MKNGLRVITSEAHSAPVFSIVVNYNVGSANERKGRTGFAHLFEHMMFKASENVGPGEHPYLMFVYGGNMNGTTNKDRTLCYEVMPSNQATPSRKNAGSASTTSRTARHHWPSTNSPMTTSA